ncbi:MAG: chloride channel protein [Magnetospirillum sp.]
MALSVKHRWRLQLSPRYWLRRMMFWAGAILVAGFAIAFAQLAEQGSGLFHKAIAWSPWLALVICPAGLAGIVFLTRRVFPGTEGSGIPQSIAALAMTDPAQRSKVLSLRIALGKVAMTTLGLCAGASVGREGPTVQIGAAIMHSMGRILRLHRPDMQRAVIIAGGAAGISAAFNTPLAGIVFAIEELSRSFEERTSGTVLTAVIVSGLASMAVLGNYTYFGRTNANIVIEQGWRAVLLCGVFGGLLGGLFARMLIQISLGVPGKVGRWIKAQPVLFAALCGLVMAAIGIVSGNNTYGTGYEQARTLLEGGDGVPASFGILKLLATLASYASGIPGGIFAPSLSVGAGLGANLAQFLPMVPVGAVVILGMTGYFVGVVQTPITAVIIVMEMTESPAMTLMLLATALISFGISRLICPQPLYRALSARFLGLRLKGASKSAATITVNRPTPPESDDVRNP